MSGMFDASTTRNSYCLNTLYRIQMIERVIKQTEHFASKTRADLEQRLVKMCPKHELQKEVDDLKMRIRLLREEIERERKRLAQLKHTRGEFEGEICETGIEMSSR